MDLHQLEAFSLATDRAKALEQFIPGTEEFYFYSCLHHEQAGELSEVRSLLEQWNKRHGETRLFCEIRNRLTLLDYERAPKETLEYLRYHLGVQFNHQRVVEGARTSHPTRLDPKLLGHEAIKRLGLSHSNANDLSGFKDAALEWLVEEKLDGQRLRQLLSRLRRPDLPRLVQLVAAELADRQSGGFGALPIHNFLLQSQLCELVKLVPALASNDNFVNACLLRLRPGPDVDWQNDAADREAFLGRLWEYVAPLSPRFNPLKAHVLYHRLDHDRRQGVYDRERFLSYLKLPRQVPYANADYLETLRRDEPAFGLGQDYRAVTLLAPIRSDEELVRDYLAHFFLPAKDARPFDQYLRDTFVRQVFATTKILNGVGDMEQWYSMLNDPGFYQGLKERVEIEFTRTNRSWFRAADAVTLEVDVKNVPTLVVKVFEINALNYFLATGREVDTSVDLDGLVASEEQTHQYSEPPLRRVRRSFSFPKLSGPGVYVVELIGGGISSRALVHKGRLRFLERAGAAGHVFTVLDEDRAPLLGAALWLGGREYQAGQDSAIDVPYSANPGTAQILLRHGALTTLETFQHQSESYQFVAGLYCDRESLLKKKEAQVVVRPTLTVNGVPASLALLEEPTLSIQSTDRDGVGSTLEVHDFKLLEDKESVHTFQVPENLASIRFSLRGKVQSLSTGKKLDLADSRRFDLNGIETTESIEDLHLARTAEGYLVYLYGKTGEPKPGVALNLTVVHRELAPALNFTLQTDEQGRVELGALPGVVTLSLTTPSGVTEGWALPRDRCRRDAIHVRAGEPFRVPFMDREPTASTPKAPPERRDASLLSLVGGSFLADHFEALSLSRGYLAVAGLPAGDYDLLLKDEGAAISIRVAPGEDRAGWIAGDRRHLERRNPKPLQISEVSVGADELVVTLGDAGPRARVHVFATRFVPAYSCFDELSRAAPRGLRAVEVGKGASHYISGRDIGDEYRYILERRFSTRFAGNLLGRPGVLLNPWAMRGTETATQEASFGAAYGASPAAPCCQPMAPPPPPKPSPTEHGPFANLDFLAQPCAALLNLKPDEKGVVRIPRRSVAHANTVRILAVDASNTVCRDVVLPEVTLASGDLRLRLALGADRHFTEKKEVTVLAERQPLEIADITTSKLEVYDTLARVFRLFASLSSDATLSTTFSFIPRWPSLSQEEKRAKYSELACHELSFFLSRKDPEFFAEVVRPYLRNKKDKTFLDRYLLGDDLSAFRTSWAFGRLNVVERILLARALADEGELVERHCRERCELLPKDLEHADHLFQSAIQSSALEAGDSLGMAKQVAAAEKMALATLDAAPRMEEAQESTRSGAGIGGRLRAAPAPGAIPSPRRAMEKSKGMKSEAVMEADEEVAAPEAFDDFAGADRDRVARQQVRQLYQKLDKTQEWAENNYYQLPIERQGPELVTITPFWRDFAAHRQGPFLSPNLAYAARSFTEMMFALSVLDLPFEADKPEVAFEGARMRLAAKSRAIAFHKEIKPTAPSVERVPVLVSQNYFRDDDRHRYENGEQVDKYVTGELLVNVVYLCQVVLTNPTSTTQKLDLLLQIPPGAIPVRSGFYTRGKHVELSAYATEALEYAFYFPTPGTFTHFPVHVARNEELIAHAPAATLTVVREPSVVDKTSWPWLSQNGEPKDVLRWLEQNNVERLAQPDGDGNVGLDLVAWRMRDKKFFDACLTLLERRHVYNPTLWSYALQHADVPRAREFLLHQDPFLDQCGLLLESPLVRLEPVARWRYQHLEYAPLVNARVQKLGARRTILNDRFLQQYTRLLTCLRYRAKRTPDDLLAVTYYLFLQDRVADALDILETIEARGLETRVQYDYLMAYAHFFREQPDAAREIARRYQDHPVDRWRNLFRNVQSQLDELSGNAPKVTDEQDRDQRQAKQVSTEPDFELSVENKTVTLHHQNLAAARVNYYRMDIELLFSRQPFVQQQSGQFSFIAPNRSDEVKLPADRSTTTFALPAEFLGANVIVEVVAAGKRKSQAYYAHELRVQVVESAGQVRVSHQGSGKPLPKTYVKVYARMEGGEVKFYKDGYTDLRGAFDYTSLSTDELDRVSRFSLLVSSEKQGSVIREADPPKR